MKFTIIQALYNIGEEPVTVVTQNPFGGLTNVATTQSDLDAARTDPTQPWGDDELLAVVAAKLPTQFPTIAGLTVVLYAAT